MTNCRICGAELPVGAIFCGECGSAVTATPYSREQLADVRPSDTAILDERIVGALRAQPAPEAEPEPEADEAAAAFVLSASTGERIVVTGHGLLGRRPVAQPETDPSDIRLVVLDDRSRSVSKTHLEFGIEGGQLWVLDRFSANGTTIVTEEGVEIECEPGRRYRVAPGMRLELGRQDIIVG